MAFEGEGARKEGARWNLPGTAVIYTSGTLSLCLLEFYVHFDAGALTIRGLDLEYRSAEIPEDLAILNVQEADLPKDWKMCPWPESTQLMGTRWILDNKFPIISVPSAIIPSERNYLINPAHPDFSKITLNPPSPFLLDPRLIERR